MSSHVLELGVKVAQGVTIAAKKVDRWPTSRKIVVAVMITAALIASQIVAYW